MREWLGDRYCVICYIENKSTEELKTVLYDSPINNGPWGVLCHRHFLQYGNSHVAIKYKYDKETKKFLKVEK